MSLYYLMEIILHLFDLDDFVVFHFWLFKSVAGEMNGKNSNETRNSKCLEEGKSLCTVLKRKVVRNSCLWGRRGGGVTLILIN